MSKLLHRVRADADLEVRAARRTIAGIAVPFDQPTEINSRMEGRFTEVFRRGSFAKTIQQRGDRVQLRVLHDGQTRLPIGKARVLREDAAGLFGEFRVSETRDGDEVLRLVADGVVDGLSIGFRPIRDNERETNQGRVIERLEVALREVSVVSDPAFEGARITGLRSLDHRYWLDPSEAQARLDALKR